jgi:hypothetical protein
MKGYYRRPSRAIEKGGGFFVPGLEGERIRIISAAALVLMLVVNHAGVQVSSVSQITSELIGFVMAIILFLQGVSYILPSGSIANAPASTFLTVIQSTSTMATKSASALESIVRTIVQTCETSYVLVYDNDSSSLEKKILIELGPVSSKAATPLSLNSIESVLTNDAAAISSASSLTDPKYLSTSSIAALKSASSGVSVPSDAASVAILVDNRNWTWVIASSAIRDDFEKNNKWITSLVAAPL